MVKFNPFRPNHIVTPGMFVGRIDELQSIEQSLFQTKHANPEHFLIEGERGIGKSSLLLYIDWLARGNLAPNDGGNYNFIVVSVELDSSFDYEDMVRFLAVELKRAVADKNHVKDLARKAWDFLSSWEILGVQYKKREKHTEPYELLHNFTNTLVNLIEGAGDQIDGVLILIDEADKPPVSANLGEFVKLLTEQLTKRGCEQVLIGLAGLPSLIPKLRESHESSPRVFTTFRLDPLEPVERVRVIHRALDDAEEKNNFKTTITSDAERLISELSEGYPHFVQEFGHFAFQEDDDNNIDVNDVLEGAYKENGALAQLGHKYFHEPFYDQIASDDYRRVLQAMAEHMDNFVTRAVLRKTAGVKEYTLNNALKALKERNIIIANERRKGEYRLPTKSFAIWIKALTSRERNGLLIGDTELPFK